MKLAISLLLLLAGTGFGQMGTTCNGGGVGPITAKKPKPYTFKLPSAGPGNGGGVSHGVMVPFHIGCIITCPPCQTTCPPEPVDVPAVQELSKAPPDCSMSAMWPAPADGWYQWGTKDAFGTVCAKNRPYITTCADKERGLWRSESGKFYCRKAQL